MLSQRTHFFIRDVYIALNFSWNKIQSWCIQDCLLRKDTLRKTQVLWKTQTNTQCSSLQNMDMMILNDLTYLTVKPSIF